MKRILIFAVMGLAVLVAVIGVIVSVRQAGARRVLNEYKTQLKARGEKLTWEEWESPQFVETNDCVSRIKTAVQEFSGYRFNPGAVVLMDLASPTNIQSCWRRGEVHFKTKPPKDVMTWAMFCEDLQCNQAPLVQIREALTKVPVKFNSNPTNLLALPSQNLAAQRMAALWLATDVVYALHNGCMIQAKEDMFALCQLVRLHIDELSLVNQMIRVHVAALTLMVTWEVLQSSGWSDADLALLQAKLEDFDLLECLEKGVLGERLNAGVVFQQMRQLSGQSRVGFYEHATGVSFQTNRSFEYYWRAYATFPIWRLNAYKDELLVLAHFQAALESIRKLRNEGDWGAVKAEIEQKQSELNELRWGKPSGIEYLVSASFVPRIQKATWVAVRNETLRRLAVIAIALKRYELRYGAYPEQLSMLSPGLLEKIPLDPMCGRQFRYQTDERIGFRLYSVGEDGVDDGGDPTPPASVKEREIWSGKDFVWPMVTPTNR